MNNIVDKTSIKKLLIANRGEIAVRVMKTAKKMGIKTVAVYSEADRFALHVKVADEAVCIGPSPVSSSYLVIDSIIQAALKSGADAIHPGYGFLSENTQFASACEQHGILFIGPSALAIELMGSKRLSKIAMRGAGVPCIPGYDGSDQCDAVLLQEALQIGFPVMIKASAGGGGRGMRLVFSVEEFVSQLKTARSEALNGFGSDELILEKALINPRHIEIQIFGDQAGNIVYLGERDCSVQRRHQKVVEEAPSPFVDQELREKMGQAAIIAAKSCQYVGAGTVEFLVDEEKNFYFLEMNTRLQVEHPVTELVYGVDLVEWQLSIACGAAIPLAQDQLHPIGHAIEVRLYAEDAENNFTPQTGKILRWLPNDNESIRIDSGIESGSIVSPFYDSMLAKVIAFGETREQTCKQLASCLDESVLLGITTNQTYLKKIITHPEFLLGNVTTSFIQSYLQPTDEQLQHSILPIALAGLIYVMQSADTTGYDVSLSGWSNSKSIPAMLKLEFKNKLHPILVSQQSNIYNIVSGDSSLEIAAAQLIKGGMSFNINGIDQTCHYALDKNALYLKFAGEYYAFTDKTFERANAKGQRASGEIKATMDGLIVDILAKPGDQVVAGQTIVVLEAMKMEHQLKSDTTGVLQQVQVKIGDQVKIRQLLATIVPVEVPIDVPVDTAVDETKQILQSEVAELKIPQQKIDSPSIGGKKKEVKHG